MNIPRSSDRYDRQRDCPAGLCVTEGILKYAAELGRSGLDRERRWQALAWLCHLVGDLHQPLHAGFRDDRGGNRVDIEYRGERTNLHAFWDSMLVNQRLQGTESGTIALRGALEAVASGDWNPADPAAWTEESHALAATRAYPPDSVIDDAFGSAPQFGAGRGSRPSGLNALKDRVRSETRCGHHRVRVLRISGRRRATGSVNWPSFHRARPAACSPD